MPLCMAAAAAALVMCVCAHSMCVCVTCGSITRNHLQVPCRELCETAHVARARDTDRACARYQDSELLRDGRSRASPAHGRLTRVPVPRRSSYISSGTPSFRRFLVMYIPAQSSKLQSCINAYSLNLDHHPSDHHYHDDDPGGLHCAAGTFHAPV